MIQAIWDYAKTDFASFIGDFSLITVLVGGLFFWLRLYFTNSFQKKLESHKGVVNSELETHKGSVNSQIEEVKHNQQKVFKEFDLYTTKMYEVYPKLYKKVEYAYGEVLNLRGVRLVLDLRKFDFDEFLEHLKDLEVFADTEKTLLIRMFAENKDAAIVEYNKKMEWIRYHKADNYWTKANNYFIVNELYLSEEAANITRELLNRLRKYWDELSPEYNGYADVIKDRQKSREELPDLKRVFKVTLKQDLKRSFSE